MISDDAEIIFLQTMLTHPVDRGYVDDAMNNCNRLIQDCKLPQSFSSCSGGWSKALCIIYSPPITISLWYALSLTWMFFYNTYYYMYFFLLVFDMRGVIELSCLVSLLWCTHPHMETVTKASKSLSIISRKLKIGIRIVSFIADADENKVNWYNGVNSVSVDIDYDNK